MKRALPSNAKIAKDAKETVQECVSEFISFITSECVAGRDGHSAPARASDSATPPGAGRATSASVRSARPSTGTTCCGP